MEENNQIQPKFPEVQPPRFPKWFWFAIIGGIFAAGILVLSFAGGTLVKEVTQEVAVEEIATEFSEVGQAAPYFELPDLKEKKVKVSDFLGKPAVITFWTTWNSLSVGQLRILSEIKGPDPLFYAIAINSQEDRSIVSNFIERGGYEIEVLLDENGSVGELYKVKTLPITYFLDKDGNVDYIYVGLLDAESIVDKVGEILNKY